MTTKQEQNPQQVFDLDESVDLKKASTVTAKKPKWWLWLAAIALLGGGTLVWRSLSSSQESTF